MSDIIEKIDWALDTIKNKYQFGLDEEGSKFAREIRAAGVLKDCKKEIERLQELEKENKSLKEDLKGSIKLNAKITREYWIDKEINYNLELKLKAKDSAKKCMNCGEVAMNSHGLKMLDKIEQLEKELKQLKGE